MFNFSIWRNNSIWNKNHIVWKWVSNIVLSFHTNNKHSLIIQSSISLAIKKIISFIYFGKQWLLSNLSSKLTWFLIIFFLNLKFYVKICCYVNYICIRMSWYGQMNFFSELLFSHSLHTFSNPVCRHNKNSTILHQRLKSKSKKAKAKPKTTL